MDTSKIYFFHNIYGDSDELISSAPSNVICVPFGWDEETERKRNDILSELNTTVPSLPSVVVYAKKKMYDLSNNPITMNAHWYPISFNHDSKPWSWEQLALDSLIEPVVKPVVKPVVEPVTELVIEPVTELVIEPVVEPVVEPVTEPVVEPVVKPVTEPVVEQVTEPVTEPVVEPLPVVNLVTK